MLYIYKDPIEDPKRKLKASEIQHITEVNASKIHTLDSYILCVEQKQDTTCNKSALQSCCGNKNISNTIAISANGIP